MKRLLGVFLTLFFISPSLFGQTTISGVINTNTTWTAANSPYIIEANVLIPDEVTLTIESGVIVKFKSDTYLKIEGFLIAIGNESDKIVFTSNETNPSRGDWDKIWLSGTTTNFDENDNYVSGTKIEYCIITYADEGLRVDESSLYLLNSDFIENNIGINFKKIDNSIIKKNNFENNGSGTSTSAGTENNGIGNFVFTKILENIFQNNDNNGFTFGGYRNNANNNLIKNNLSINNGGDGFSFRWGDVVRGFADNIIEGNIIYKNAGNGITIGRDNNVIKRNIIVDNNGSGIGISGTYIYEGLIIENNIISGNKRYGIDLSSNTNTLVLNNSIINSGSDSNYPSIGIPDSYIASSNNVISNNTIFGSVNNSIELMYGPNEITNNNFIGWDANLVIKLLSGNSTDINATNNYWGTIDESVISGLIYDYYDDFELGEVDYSNFLSSKSTLAPVSPPVNVEKSTNQGNLKITWTANTESDLAGYKIYYGNFSGYSFSNSIDVGNVTEYVLDLPSHYKDSTIAVTTYDIDLDDINDMTEGNESWYSIATYNPIFYLEENNVTINCFDAEIGDTFEINDTTYTKRNIEQITTKNAATTCTSGIDNMDGLFENEISFNEDISHWDVSSVKNMNEMFFRAESFNQNINYWDVSNVEGMNHMFAVAKSFDQPLGDWDVSSVKTMNSMFASTPFNQDISGWNLESSLTTDAMFAFNTEFNQDISSWNVSSVENMQIMFERATSFNQPLNEWDVSSVTNMRGMFNGASSFNQPINMWDVTGVTSMKNMFSNSIFNQNITNWDTRNVENMNFMFFENNVFNQDISKWCVSKITEQPESFISATSPLEKLPEWGRCNEIDLFIPHINSYTIDTTYTGVYQNIYSNSGFNSFQFSLFYDPDSINIEVLDFENTIAKDFELIVNKEQSGQIIVSGAGTKSIKEDGKLLNLKIDYNVGGQSSIYLRDLNFDEDLFTGKNSKINIISEFLLCGDVTADNTVTALDAAHILRHTVRLSPQYPLEGRDFIAGDVTNNGAVTAYDAYFVLRDIVGMGSGLSCTSTIYNLKEGWTPKLNWSVYSKGSELVTSISFSEIKHEVNALELEILNGAELKVTGLPADWNTIEYTREGTQYLSMYGLTPLITPELKWVQTTGQTIAVKIRVNESNWQTIVHELEANEVLPEQYVLSQNYPNPFNPSTQIQYALPEATEVTLEVFNSVGQKVMELVNGQQSAGYHRATFDASGLSSGVYLYMLTTPSFTQTKKMLLIK